MPWRSSFHIVATRTLKILFAAIALIRCKKTTFVSYGYPPFALLFPTESVQIIIA